MSSAVPEQLSASDALLSGLPADRRGVQPSKDLIGKREQFGVRPYDGPVPLTPQTINGVSCIVLDGGGDTTVLYLHGGGYRMGSAAAYAPYAARLAAGSGARIVVVDYRLAPEVPFPGALRDAAIVYVALRAQDPGRPIIVAGDSAGGGLAAALVVLTARTGSQRPDGMAVLSPWLDMQCQSSTYRTATDPIFDLDTARTARESYLQGHDATDPLVSPLLADPAEFPPTLVQVGTTETLLADALALVNGLVSAGASCELHAVAGRGHTWPLIEPAHPDSHAALATLSDFVRRVGQMRL